MSSPPPRSPRSPDPRRSPSGSTPPPPPPKEAWDEWQRSNSHVRVLRGESQGVPRRAEPRQDRDRQNRDLQDRPVRTVRPERRAASTGRRGGLRTRRGRQQPDAARVDRELFRQPSGHYATAGRIIGVGLLCFGLWTLFDANQLYHSALASPTGTRRSVAASLLRPIAAVSNTLGLSGLVNWGDSILGRSNGAAGGYVKVTVPPVPRIGGGGGGTLPYIHKPGYGLVGSTGNSTPAPSIPPMVQPTASHPMTILDIGDSIGEDLGLGLGDVFGSDPYVKIIQKAVESTGLARPDYYNWPLQLQNYLRQYHPQAVIVMMGANDDQALNQNGSFVTPGSSAWAADYQSRVQLIIEEALAANARVVWVGLPPMAGTAIQSPFAKQVNSIVQSACQIFPGVTYVPSWNLLANKSGGFTQYLNINGSEEQIRSADGVHLYPAGYDLLAHSLVQPMQQAWNVNLHA